MLLKSLDENYVKLYKCIHFSVIINVYIFQLFLHVDLLWFPPPLLKG